MASKTSAAASRAAPSLPGEAEKPNSRAIAKGLGAVVMRNEFYRDGYRVLQSIAVMQSIIICLLVFVMLYVVHIHQPENRYFATTEDGRLLPMVPLNEPNLSTPALTSWAAQAAAEVMTFGFNDYKRRLQESSRNFTRTGWGNFNKALVDAKIIEGVEKQLQTLNTVPVSAPTVVQEGLFHGRYQWIVQMRAKGTFSSAVGTTSRDWIIRMTIVRVPRLESPMGVGIEQWVAE